MTEPLAPVVDCEQYHAALPVSDVLGVGPHNKTDLRHIEKLKQKHGIDYDSHASYRFVER